MAVVAAATPDAPPWSERRHRSSAATAQRTSYDVDRDRIIHSETFRELQHKTQVQSLVRLDGRRSFRTRLNHVLEVAQIARGLARAIGATEALAEAIALAHDLGHPPFGHAGERALRRALQEHGAPEWNANVHSLAVVDDVECAFIDFRGLDLTRATREGIARHATPFDEPISFGDFATTRFGGLECQIVDAADVLAYLSHDLDDAVATEYLDLDELRAAGSVLEDLLADAGARWDAAERVWPGEDRPILLRHWLRAHLIHRCIRDLALTARERLGGHAIESADAVRNADARVVVQSPEFEAATRALLELLLDRYYRSDRVSAMDAAAETLLRALFDALLADTSRLPERFKVGPSEAVWVAFYVASLNDLSAVALADDLGIAYELPPEVRTSRAHSITS